MLIVIKTKCKTHNATDSNFFINELLPSDTVVICCIALCIGIEVEFDHGMEPFLQLEANTLGEFWVLPAEASRQGKRTRNRLEHCGEAGNGGLSTFGGNIKGEKYD